MPEYHLSTTLLLGNGARHELPEHLDSLNISRGLLVTDQSIKQLGYPAEIQQILHDAGLETVVFDEVTADPSSREVAKGLQQFLDKGCDFIVAVGGGSSIDCAKGIVLVARDEFAEEVGEFGMRFPLIAIPTTAGTGSEVSQYVVLTDSSTHQKEPFERPSIIPSIAVCDAELTDSLPPDVTTNTGLDAFTHALEAYISTEATVFTDALARQALREIYGYLNRAVYQGQSDEEAREKMMEAQMLAGMAFSNSGLGYVHATAHALGSEFNIPHGRANAVMLPHVLRFNRPACVNKLADLLPVLAPEQAGGTREESAKTVESLIEEFLRNLEIPKTLSNFGVTKDDVSTLAKKAHNDPVAESNPRPASLGNIEQIFERALS